MIEILWEFRVKPERREQFERHYSPSGAWAEFFRKGAGYRRTELLRDTADPQRYVTVDVWDDLASYDAFKAQFADEYAAIDKMCADLTTAERLLGIFQPLP